MSPDPLQHEIKLELASGARLTILYFSDRELRWIFTYRYIGETDRGASPEIVNDVRLTVDYADGLIAPQIVLSMHVILPSRLGRQFLAGMDISPGAKTYFEFNYERHGEEYRLIEICKGARGRVRLDEIEPALVKSIKFPFPVADRLLVGFGHILVPVLLNDGTIAHFDLPTRTLR